MAELMAVARELSKMRLRAQTKEYPRDLAQSYAECLLLEKYGRLPSMLDLKRDSKRKVTLIPKDGNNALIRVVAQSMFPMRVYRPWLTADIFVFIKTGNLIPMSHISGWLTSELVLAMPQKQLPDRANGDFCYQIEASYLIPMPDTFLFEEPEHHISGDWNGAWDDKEMGWECFTCGRRIPDPKTRAVVLRESQCKI